ncbi:MAG: hypothetical protein ACMVY4_07125 [Minwuia sp.]|uniref:hypothetical protein n=1 Tax=Minwuia sp. TaxID=2493630 RepID=UPI003A83BBA5
MRAPEHIVSLVTGIQESLFERQGLSKDQVLAVRDYLERGPVGHRSAKPETEWPADIEVRSIVLERLNEYTFGDYQETRDMFINPRLTQYDKTNMVRRFVNLFQLCREEFGNIRSTYISTIPTMMANGLCITTPEDEDVILISEGLLYGLPNLIKVDVKYDFPNIQAIAENPHETDESTRSKFIQFANLLVGGFISLIAEGASPDRMRYSPAKPVLFTGFDTWRSNEILQKSILKTLDTFDRNEILRYPTDNYQIMYYKLRGIVLFIIAHEFSHAANEHNSIRATGEVVASEEFVQILLQNLINIAPKYDGVALTEFVSPHFLRFQPLEIQADADAMYMISRYAERHQLSDYQTQAMYEGVALLYTLINMYEESHLAARLGSQDAIKVISTHPHERNITMSREHPCPYSRPELALQVAQSSYNLDSERIIALIHRSIIKYDLAWGTIRGEVFRQLDAGELRLQNDDILSALPPLRSMGHIDEGLGLST